VIITSLSTKIADIDLGGQFEQAGDLLGIHVFTLEKVLRQETTLVLDNSLFLVGIDCWL
jgi:hypothetical protein